MTDGFYSEMQRVGHCEFPKFTGLRVMMMPFRMDDFETVPDLYRQTVRQMICNRGLVGQGVGYLTIDEAIVRGRETHRRPGLHVDGIGPDGRAAGWGGGPAYAGQGGMYVAASAFGCLGYVGEFQGWPKPDGDCEHLRPQLDDHRAHAPAVMRAGEVWWCSPLGVHESVPMAIPGERQFVRISTPSDAPWYEGYTPSPYGVKPTGPIHPRREKQMGFRP